MKSFHPGAVLLLMSAGCIVVDGSYLCDDGRCPDGLTCDQARCVAEGEGEAPLDVDWAGTWSVSVAHNATCDDGFGDITTANKSGTWLVELKGTNEATTATVGPFFELHGVANATHLTVTGGFPLVGTDNAEAASTSDAVTVAVDASSTLSAAGSASGTFATAFGLECTINHATVTFTR